MESPRRESWIQFFEKSPPGGVFYGWVQQRSPQVFWGKRCCRESQNTSDVPLSCGWVLKKKSWDLEALIEVPEASEKRESRSFKAFASWDEGWPKSIVSSTNYWWDKGWRPWREIPFRAWEDTAEWSRRLIPSATRTKRKGDRGSPWRIPQDGKKGDEGEPLNRTEKEREEMRFMIHLVQVALKPNANNI